MLVLMSKISKILPKKPEKLVILDKKTDSEIPLKGRAMKAKKRAELLVAVAERLKRPKIDLKAHAQKLFEDNLKTLKAFQVSIDDKGNEKREAYAFDAAEISNGAPLLSAGQLSYNIISKFDQAFIGWQNCALLQQNGFINKICSLPANDAMATGYTLSYAENKGEADNEKLESLKRRSEIDYQIDNVCVQANKNKRLFGYALVVPTWEEEDVDMSHPFSLEAVKGKTYTGLKVVDPNWITYDFDQRSLIDPTYKYFYEPTWYRFATGSQVLNSIHRSWCIKLINAKVADIMKPAYFFGGVPTSQQVFEAVYAYEKALNEAILLLLTKRTFIADADMVNYMANPEEVTSLLDAMALLHNNYGIMVKQTGSEVSQMDTALTGMDEIINALFQRVAGIAEMTTEKLLNAPVKGFNSTGKFEDKDYKEHLLRIQKYDYQPILQMHYKLLTYTESKRGKALPLICTFNPVDTPDQETTAKIRESNAKTLMLLAGSKIVSNEEVRDVLRNDPNSGLSTLSAEMPKISEEQLEAFSVEKDNQGRPLPKAKDDVVRGKTKEDISQ